MERTQVGIVGAGPAGLFLSHLLHLAGIDNVVIEARSREYIEGRIRAGVLEHGVVEALEQAGVGARMREIGLPHEGTNFLFGGTLHRIDFQALTGKSVMVYSQHEVVRDLVAARIAAQGNLIFEAADVRVEGFGTGAPVLHYKSDGTSRELLCDIVAGCDGFHGICRPSFGPTAYDRIYPFGWLGILAEAPMSTEELVYANHDRGFALLSMRSPQVQRMYLQCAPDEDVEAWSDDRIWSELETRLQNDRFTLKTGRIFQRGVTPMRSYVAEPMQSGRLFLAGDAGHIVPPTGAKGMNSAIGDVMLLARALERWFKRGDESGLNAYSATALRRIWKVQRFSWWMTTLFHRFENAPPFDRRVQLAELDYVTTSKAAATALAENYVGLPLEAS
ncbi:MAG TPA: 4-hydroxybenzoate 3-monooxygenase [Acetobacteraceae bacterium]|nr:4-hydroxybenzoate 3-monooxygenase [Acetobacteraceae bacterium]